MTQYDPDLAASITATGQHPTMQMGTAPNVDGMTHNVTERISVTRVGVFRDDTAYNSRRSVYVIIDNKTGKEYIGVSGVGISETGSHSTGKSTITDER